MHDSQDDSLVRALFQRAVDLLLATDQYGVVRVANPAARALVQLGERLADRVHPDDRVAFDAACARALGDGEAPLLEIRLGSDEDGWSWISWTLAGLDGGLALVGRDVTDRAMMEAQLRFADRMLSVGTLASGVAHEINNPLAAVLANLRYVESEVGAASMDVEEVSAALDDAVAGAERVGQIVTALRTFAKGDDLEPRPIELLDVLARALDLAAHPLRLKARLVQELQPVPHVIGEASRLTQVFVNLLVNAAQALPEGRADREEVVVRARTTDVGDALVEVEDSGPGVPPEHLHRVFDPFFTTKPVGTGAGLGLWAAHGTVAAMGGTIDYRREGSRTVFRIQLPGLDRRTPARAERVSLTPHRRAHLLVIDDDPMVVSSLIRLLGRRYDVEAVPDGRIAVTRLLAGPDPDVILCDLLMPEITGMQLHARLSEGAPHLLARMVFVTGGAFSPAARAFVASVRAPTLDKPLDYRQLVRVIDDIVARSSD